MRRIAILGFHTSIFGIWYMLVSASVGAQHMPTFLQHTNTQVLSNPSWAMEIAHPQLSSRYRSQWLGYASTYDARAGAPQIGQIQFIYPFFYFPMALGLSFTQDEVGPLQHQLLQFVSSYRVRLSEKSTLSFGLMPVYAIHNLRRDVYRPRTFGDHTIDAAIDRSTRFDITMGVLYAYGRAQFGLSAHNVSSSSFEYVLGGEENVVPRVFHVYGGYQFILVPARRYQRSITLTPRVLWRTDIETFHALDALLMAEYGEQVRVGMGWKRHESLTTVVGIKILAQKNLDISYAFEFIVQDSVAKQATSHEIRLAYDMLFLEIRKRKPIRTPRFRI